MQLRARWNQVQPTKRIATNNQRKTQQFQSHQHSETQTKITSITS